MSRVILFHKPYGVLSQFTPGGTTHPTLADYIDLPGVYVAGRLDRDSEGLLVLTDNGVIQHRLSDPRYRKTKSYWVQVEREPDAAALRTLSAGLMLRDGLTAPAKVRRIDPPRIPPRDPPVRFRKTVPTAWIELEITEGRNRQVRRMTAAVGFPTLRLVRHRVGPYSLGELARGAWRDAPAGGR